MTGIGLRRVIDADFINRFSALTSGSSSTDRIKNALSGGGATTFASSLRTGAQVYAQAVQGFNATINFLNITRSSLEDLGNITDDLVTILERATAPSTGRSTLRRLQREFDSLGDDFREIVENAKVGDRQLLSKEGLEELFLTVGLDPDKSGELSDIFQDLLLNDDKDTEGTGSSIERFFLLASERTKADRPVSIPPNVYGTSSTEIALGSPSLVDFGALSNPSAFEVSSINNIAIVNPSGTDEPRLTPEVSVAGGLVPGLTSDVELFDVSETTGYSLFASTENFLGSNGLGVEQLYLADQYGNVLHQFTSNSSALNTFTDANLSADGLKVAYLETNALQTDIKSVSVTGAGDYGNTANNTTLTLITDGTVNPPVEVEINNEGTYIAAIENDNSVTFIQNSAAPTPDAVAAAYSDAVDVAFTDVSTILIAKTDGTIDSLAFGGASSTLTLTNSFGGTDSDDLVAVQGENTFAFSNVGGGQVHFFSDGNETTLSSVPILNLVNLSIANATGTEADDQYRVGVTAQFALTNDFVSVLVSNASDSGTLTESLETPRKSYRSVEAGYISQNGLVVQDTDTTSYNGYNTSNQSIITETTLASGEYVSMSVNVTQDVTLLALDEFTGRSVIGSTQDFLGNGTGGFNNLFIMDEAGRVIKQLTNNTDANTDFIDVAIANDATKPGSVGGQSEIYFIETGLLNNYVRKVEPADYDTATIPSATTLDSSASSSFSNLQTSPTGGMVAYFDSNNSTGGVKVTDGTNTRTYSPSTYGAKNYGFISEDQFVLTRTSGSSQEIIRTGVNDLTLSAEPEAIIRTGLGTVANFSIQPGRRSTDSVFAFQDRDVSRVYAYTATQDSSGNFVSLAAGGEYSYDPSIEDITDLDIATPAAGQTQPRLAILGDQSETTSTDFDRVVELQASSVTNTKALFSRQLNEVTELFSGGVDLREKPSNFLILADLKALREQIDENVEQVENLVQFVGENLDLVRAAGFALLDLSESADSVGDAELLAASLRKRIRAEERQAAAAHGENLFDIAAAAITLSEDSFGLGDN